MHRHHQSAGKPDSEKRNEVGRMVRATHHDRLVLDRAGFNEVFGQRAGTLPQLAIRKRDAVARQCRTGTMPDAG
jgi:hypothetical protein